MTAPPRDPDLEAVQAADEAAADPARWEAALRPIVAGGLRWLYDTSQPPQAILQHHGATLWTPAINRNVQLVPSGWKGCVVVVLGVSRQRWGAPTATTAAPLLNGLQDNELVLFADLVAELGRKVIHDWNGAEGMDSGSLALADPAHPALLAAVTRYHAGCGTHHTVFCSREGCDWYRDGYAMVVKPEVAEAAA